MTIHNQHPASSAKYGVLDDAVLALYERSAADPDGSARAIRTQPPQYADGVSQLAYSGAYPVTRLRVLDDALTLQPTLYAYSRLVPGDEAASAIPAVAFSLTVANPSASPARAALYFSLPFAAINDCARLGGAPLPGLPTATYRDCLHACAQKTGCASWSHNGTWCFLADSVPHSVFRAGWHCGVSGTWSVDSGAITLHATPEGAATSAAAGNMSLFASSDGAMRTTVSFAAADDPASLFASFAAGAGTFANSSDVFSGAFANVVAGHGAAAVAVDLAGYSQATLTIVLAWYFPERDHMGVNVGNFYSTFAKSSEDFAWMATSAELARTVHTIAALHGVFFRLVPPPT